VLPLRDENPSNTRPGVVYGLIALNALIFFVELSLPPETIGLFMGKYGLVPAKAFTAIRGGQGLVKYFVLPLFTSVFLHGGWLHVIGNMWYLWIFGDNIEDRLGHWRFILFYVVCGLAAGMVHMLFNPHSTAPTIGASGAIAGVLGAYIVSFPRARVVCLVPLFYIITVMAIPASVVLLFWFGLQLLSGTFSLGSSTSGGGVAYWAHIGGFVAGLILVNVLPRSRRSRQSVYVYRRWGRHY